MALRFKSAFLSREIIMLIAWCQNVTSTIRQCRGIVLLDGRSLHHPAEHICAYVEMINCCFTDLTRKPHGEHHTGDASSAESELLASRVYKYTNTEMPYRNACFADTHTHTWKLCFSLLPSRSIHLNYWILPLLGSFYFMCIAIHLNWVLFSLISVFSVDVCWHFIWGLTRVCMTLFMRSKS